MGLSLRESQRAWRDGGELSERRRKGSREGELSETEDGRKVVYCEEWSEVRCILERVNHRIGI